MPGTWTVLVTGGAGFVGAHTVIPLLNANYSVIVVDNLVNAYKGTKRISDKTILQLSKI